MKAKLAALERVAKDAIHTDYCAACGYPDPDGRSVILLEADADGKAQVRRCGTCHRFLDESGVPYGQLWGDGQVHLSCVVLHPAWGGRDQETALASM